jgi:hypothetical protein
MATKQKKVDVLHLFQLKLFLLTTKVLLIC